MKKYSLAVFIGRFQPFHNGHLYSLKKAAQIADHVLVGIGSSQESGTENNPWTFEQRKKMVGEVVHAEKLENSVVDIVSIPDFATDDEWADYVQHMIEEPPHDRGQIVIVGNNPWTNEVMKKAGYDVYETGLYERDELEGVKIRSLMRSGNNEWKSRVPKAVNRITL
jgi:nicotinamide-nucleotide adenylyltransferase